MPTYTFLSVRLRKPVDEQLVTLLLIKLTIGNNTTADNKYTIADNKYATAEYDFIL